MSVSAAEFRQVLSRWASGVSIVTTQGSSGKSGTTVSAFTSVSLEPPLILICFDQASQTLATIAQSRRFCVNILSEGQQELSNRFAKPASDDERFAGVVLQEEVAAGPRLAGAVACLDCDLDSEFVAGDHQILIGRVVQTRLGEGRPLLYFRGGYCALAPGAG